MIQQAKLPTSQPASCGYWPRIFYLSAASCVDTGPGHPTSNHFPPAVTGKAAADSPNSLHPGVHKGHPEGAPGSQLQPASGCYSHSRSEPRNGDISLLPLPVSVTLPLES